MLPLAAALVVLLAPRVSAAQTFTFVPHNHITGEDFSTETELDEYINMARCLCDQHAEATEPVTFSLDVTASTYNSSDQIYFYLGDECTDAGVVITEQCHELAVITHSDFIREQTVLVPANRIVDPINGICSAQESGTSTVFVIRGDPSSDAVSNLILNYDTRPPDPPGNVTANGGESAVSVRWDPPAANNDDIEFYNAVCAYSDTGGPVAGVSSSANASWDSPETVCDKTLSVDATPTDPTPVPCDLVGGGFSGGVAGVVNPCFACGQAPAGSDELRITGLDNGRPIDVAMVAVDRNGNVSAISNVVSATPIPTQDFAEHYRLSGGQEDGGFCFVATAIYGGYDHENVRKLRGFRDDVLKRSAAGRSFVRWYYANGRELARVVKSSVILTALTHTALSALVFGSDIIRTWDGDTTAGLIALPLYLAFFWLLLGLRARLRRRWGCP